MVASDSAFRIWVAYLELELVISITERFRLIYVYEPKLLQDIRVSLILFSFLDLLIKHLF